MIRTHTEVRFDDLIYAWNALKASENGQMFKNRCHSPDSLGFYKKSIEKIVNNEVEGITPEVIGYTKQILEQIIEDPIEKEVFEWAKTILAKISNKEEAK